MSHGYILLHRKLTSSDLWLAEKFTKGQAWVDLIANASHGDSSFWVRGIEVKLTRGQLGWSELTLAKRWGWSRNKTRLFLKWLKKEQQIEQQKVQQITSIITIKNYNQYQLKGTTKGTTDYTTSDTTEGTHTIHDNKTNKENSSFVDNSERELSASERASMWAVLSNASVNERNKYGK